jgi:hypothetical protein
MAAVAEALTAAEVEAVTANHRTLQRNKKAGIVSQQETMPASVNLAQVEASLSLLLVKAKASALSLSTVS